MLQDLRFTFRLIVKERWYFAVAVIVLALGIGVNAVGFTIINATLLRGPAFKDSEQLYMLSWQSRAGRRVNISYPELQDLRAQGRSFRGIAAFVDGALNISDDRAWPEPVPGSQMTANAFAVLQQLPFIGRDFATAEDAKGAQPVAILSYKLWQRRYTGDPNVLGRSIRVNGQPATIIGVMPDKMNFPINAELWIPLIPAPHRNSAIAAPSGFSDAWLMARRFVTRGVS